ncbi:hypothetical protein LXA43DRAFT_658194 [Ganoderma leucocontextum]|nr:hypothetical protein LXA43DRAFT_658194 [Ganoderma leucocontextum]
MLSDITEADEPNAQDISIQDSKPSPSLLHVRTLSFSSFGSPYPSSCFGSPSPNSPQFYNVTTTCVDSRVATSVPSPNHLVLAQTTAQSASHEVASLAEPPSSPDSSTSDLVPFVVEPLLSSYSVNEPAANEGLADERKNEYGADIVPMPTTTTSVVPSASTYADATNVSSVPDSVAFQSSLSYQLALQHPEMASDILRRPLSSASASGCPSKFPTPSVSCSVSLQVVPPASSACTPMRASTPHTTERPNWALAPDVRSPGLPNLVMASKAHTAEHPNWALAKDGQKATAGRQSRSRSRGRGRSGTRPPSITRGAQAEQRTRRGGQGSDADRTEPAPKTIPTSAVVSPKQPPECGDALPAVPSQTADLEDGPQQWLNRVNSWVEQTSRGAKTCPGTPDRDSDAKCAITTPSSPKEPSSQPQCHSRTTTSGLNPHAPAWTPTPRARCQTPSDSDSAPPATQGQSSPSTSSVRGPFTFGVDADIDRLRDMLRNCGIQDREIDTSSIRDNLTTTGSTPARLEKTGGVAPNDDGSQENTVPCGTREASKTPGRLDTQGTLHPQPDVPRQGFEFTTPTRLGPPFSTAGPMLGRPSSFPQSLFATPPRLTFQRANTQYFRKEPGGPWISGYLDPNAPPSGPSFFPQPSPRPAAFPGSAPGSAHLSFSQSSRSFSRTCQPEPGRGSPSPFAPGAYKVHVNCAERGQDAPVPGAPASPFTSGVKRARQPTAGPSTFNFKSQRFA